MSQTVQKALLYFFLFPFLNNKRLSTEESDYVNKQITYTTRIHYERMLNLSSTQIEYQLQVIT